MMSSSSATALAPAHPEAAEKEPAAVAHGHPQIEPGADKEIADQRQHRDAEPDRDKSRTDPQSDDDVDHHEIGRPEHAELPRREVPQPDRPENSKGKEQHERRERPEIKVAYAHTPPLERADCTRTGETRCIHGYPDEAGLARPQIAGDVAEKDQHTPQDQ